MTDASQTAASKFTAAQWDRIYDTMNPNLRNKIAAAFVAAMDRGLDILNPTTGESPAGESVLAGFVADARARGWDAGTISMLRWNVRAVGRRIINDVIAELGRRTINDVIAEPSAA